MSETRRERRNNDPKILAKRAKFQSGNILSGPLSGIGSNSKGSSGGWGLGMPNAKPATGVQPSVNPFIIPKAAGINVFSQTYPSNYFQEWDLSAWRSACDQVLKMGYTLQYATLVNWAYECSPFIRSLFEKLGAAIERIPVSVVDKKGNKIDEWTKELCESTWTIQLRKELLFSYFWGFSGINFDPVSKKLYKYPIQDIDPINRILRQNTFSFYDGESFEEHDNLLFIQPSTAYESFLGWMQPITRSFIQMNLNKNNWIAAGKKHAYPLLTVGYPQNDGGVDVNGNQINPYKNQAEEVAANIDPSQGLTYPYTKDAEGNIQKSLEIGFENPGSSAGMHALYKDFNSEEKAEILQMIFGGELTSSTGKTGSYAMAEVQERQLDAVVEAKMGWILSILNNDFLGKIKKFYKNLPEDIEFKSDSTKTMTVDEILKLSQSLKLCGKQLTDEFYEANGIAKEFIEDAIIPSGGDLGSDNNFSSYIEIPKKTMFSAIKKKF